MRPASVPEARSNRPGLTIGASCARFGALGGRSPSLSVIAREVWRTSGTESGRWTPRWCAKPRARSVRSARECAKARPRWAAGPPPPDGGTRAIRRSPMRRTPIVMVLVLFPAHGLRRRRAQFVPNVRSRRTHPKLGATRRNRYLCWSGLICEGLTGIPSPSWWS